MALLCWLDVIGGLPVKRESGESPIDTTGSVGGSTEVAGTCCSVVVFMGDEMFCANMLDGKLMGRGAMDLEIHTGRQPVRLCMPSLTADVE